jgi:hypothetical protein
MSQFYDQASLVMVPSGYKTGKVYSQKPLSTDGELTFTRASSATRVGPDGLIEKVRTNLILQSEAFNTTWTDNAATVTPNTTANPLNGALTADTITLGAGTVIKYLQQSVTAFNGLITHSVYLKAGTHQFIQLLSAETAVCANFDLVNGTASSVSSTAQIVALANGWYRCSISYTATISPSAVYIWAVDSLASARAAATASTGTFIAFGYQHETGDIATDYIATTSAAVSVGPVANLPRLDYLGSSCPRLILEGQRTNLNTYSEDISQAGQYLATRVTISKNSVVSPDGYTNADKIVQDPSNTSWGGVAQGISPSGLVTLSLFAKKIDNDYIAILGHNSIPTAAWFNIATGTTGTKQAGVTSSKIEDYGNGWFRCSITTSVCNRFSVFHTTADGGTTAPVNSETALWGFQQEDGASYATSYIPTLGAAVTRGADAAVKTSATALIGQTEGTFFAEVDFTDTNADQMYLTLSDGTTNNRIHIGFDNTSNWLYCNIRSGGAAQGLITQSSPSSGIKKIAVGYKLNNYVLYINGVQVGVDNSALVPACSRLDVGGYFSAGFEYPVKQALLFKTRLSNADLATLTTI